MFTPRYALAAFALCFSACEGEPGSVDAFPAEQGRALEHVPALDLGSVLSEPTDEPMGPGILEELLKPARTIRSTQPEQVAGEVLECLYRDGDLAALIELFDWHGRGCAVGKWKCADLQNPARRAGALLALAPGSSLRPAGLAPEVFQVDVASTLEALVPSADRELPVAPTSAEVLFRFRDHHGLTKFLVLRKVGDRWRLAALGRDDQLAR